VWFLVRFDAVARFGRDIGEKNDLQGDRGKACNEAGIAKKIM